MSAEEIAKARAAVGEATVSGSFGIGKGGFSGSALIFWAFVGIPLAWGTWVTLINALRMF